MIFPPHASVRRIGGGYAFPLCWRVVSESELSVSKRSQTLAQWSEVNQQLADAVGVPRTTLQSAVARGEIQTITAGTQRETVLVSVAAVRRWARNRKAKT